MTAVTPDDRRGDMTAVTPPVTRPVIHLNHCLHTAQRKLSRKTGTNDAHDDVMSINKVH